MDGNKTFSLECNDGTKIEIDLKSCEKSGLLKRLTADFQESNIILGNNEVDPITCKAIVEYLIHYREINVENIKEIWKPVKKIAMREITHGDIWAADFIDQFQPLDLVTLSNVSSFFEIPSLCDLALCKIATFFVKYQDDMPKLREIFNIPQDMNDQQLMEFTDQQNKGLNPYEVVIRDNLQIWHEYDEEHNMDD